MTLRMPASLQRRLLVLVIGLVTAVWIGAGVTTWFDARHEVDELLDSHLAQAAALLVMQQTGEIHDDHSADVPSLHRYAPRVAFQVFHEGQLALRSAAAPAQPMAGSGEEFRPGFRTVRIDRTMWRVFATYGPEHDIQVYVGEQLDSRTSILLAILRSMFWPMLVALPLLALAVWWAVRAGVAPMHRLGRVLAAREPDALHPVDIGNLPSEMRPMVDALNNLLTRISALMELERRFNADAAHELRTPIAAIRTQAQVALAETDDVRRAHALRATLEGCDRAAHLVEQLLTLSRLESGANPDMPMLDLAALLRRAVADIAPQAIHKRQQLAVDAPDSACMVAGDATLLDVLVRNLVDNAVRYTPAGGTVQLRPQPSDAGLQLVVTDSGPGLEAADMQRLGERFFRVLGSGQSGSGLGWSIVRRVAAVHHAAVRVARCGSLGGLEVTLTWPSRPSRRQASA